MKKEVFNFLRKHCLTDPESVNRLIVSSFLHINDITIYKNELISNLIIKELDTNEFLKLNDLIEIIEKTSGAFSFEDLIEFFEFVVSPADKIVTGAVYTPNKIREFIIDNAFQAKLNNHEIIRIADISCGCGSFLFDSARKLKVYTGKAYSELFQFYLFGLDIQEYSINRTKILLSLLAIKEGEDVKNFNFNLFNGDALAFDWNKSIPQFDGFDIIVGNPPYVCSRNISEETRKHINKWDVCKTGHPDLYIPFFQIGLECLQINGFLGYITMNTFFKSVNGRALRDYFQRKGYKIRIIDFGNKQVFNSKSTYTCICLIEKKHSDYIEYIKREDDYFENHLVFKSIRYSSLNSFQGWNLNSIDILNKIENTGTPFGELYKTRNGIATLKNNIYIFDPIKESNNYYFLQNGNIFEIEKGICKDIINPNRLTQNVKIEEIKSKIIFPYYFEDNRAMLLKESVLETKYPKAYSYLKEKKEILSTRDKGNGSYENWYAFGRNQSLERMKNKLFFPHITPDIPNYSINTDENLLFYNGLAVITENETELLFLQKLMVTKLFWFYIKNSSKPYSSGYYSLSRNYIKNFGVYNFTLEEKLFIIDLTNPEELNEFIEFKYELSLKQFC